MEYGLRRDKTYPIYIGSTVLILVVMEYGLRRNLEETLARLC